jgi:hypothetical protein
MKLTLFKTEVVCERIIKKGMSMERLAHLFLFFTSLLYAIFEQFDPQNYQYFSFQKSDGPIIVILESDNWLTHYGIFAYINKDKKRKFNVLRLVL